MISLFGSNEPAAGLLSILVENIGAGCNAALGLIRVSWTTEGNMAGRNIQTQYAIPAGSGIWSNIGSLQDPLNLTEDYDLSGVVGFTTLDDTDIRIRLLIGAVDQNNSPLQSTPPPYIC